MTSKLYVAFISFQVQKAYAITFETFLLEFEVKKVKETSLIRDALHFKITLCF